MLNDNQANMYTFNIAATTRFRQTYQTISQRYGVTARGTVRRICAVGFLYVISVSGVFAFTPTQRHRSAIFKGRNPIRYIVHGKSGGRRSYVYDFEII